MNTIIAKNERTIHTNPVSCSLCGQRVKRSSSSFCCHGCQAVYEILSANQELSKKENHPLYLQAVKYGIISNPELTLPTAHAIAGQWTLQIEGMWCPACATLISLLMLKTKGVKACHVDYMTDMTAIDFDPMLTSKEELIKKIEKWGYKASEATNSSFKKREFSLTLRLVIASFCALNVMMFTYPLFSTFFDQAEEGVVPILSWISLGLTLPVVTYSAWPIYRRFYFGLREGFLGMEALVVLGIAASLSVSFYEMAIGSHRVYFDTVTMLIALLLFGKAVEQKAKFSSKEAQMKLHLLSPRKGRKRTEAGQFEIVSIKEIKSGDVIQILSGERVVLDGIVMGGDASVDESSMTGESTPIYKRVGDPVLSGSILLSGILEVKVTADCETSSLKKLIQQTQGALLHKTEISRLVDRIAQAITPAVLTVTTAAFAYFLSTGYGFQEAFLRATSALLIACPCAIGIAAPLAESSLIDVFSKKGAIVRNRSLFSKLAQATLFVFDKTGTVTEGKLELVNGLSALSDDQKTRLKSLSACSLHPVSQAISASIEGAAHPVQSLKEMPGFGVSGIIGGKSVSIGAARWMVARGVEVPALSSVHSVCCYEEEGYLVAQIELKDRLREGALNLPIKKLLLSGDREEPVKKMAELLGFSSYAACMTPLEKQERIRALKFQGEVIVFVGDGMNDAPSLAEAHVGVSVLQASDMAYQASDLYLLNGKLDLFQELVAVSIKGERVQRQNFFWAFFYNAIGIPLALAGILTPLFATFAMTASSLIVLLNSKRITSRE